MQLQATFYLGYIMTHAFTHYRQQQLVRFLAVLLSITFCASLTAAEQSQTLILVGSELSSCSSLNMQQCDKNTQIAGKAEHLFSVTAEKVKKIRKNINNKMNDVIDNSNLTQNQKLTQISKYHALSTIFWEAMDESWRDVIDTLEEAFGFKLF